MLTPSQLRRQFRFRSFDEFLGAIREMCMVLSDPAALERASYELARELKRNGVEYAEIYTSPYIYVRWGNDYGEVLRAVDRGFSAAERDGGAICAILLDSVRQWGPDAAHRVLDGFEQNHVDRVVGFGLGGEERVALADFRDVFSRARSIGLRTVVHAGEGAPAKQVWDAIDLLQVDRIAHGIRAVDDPQLLATLATRGVVLDVSVTSNYRTCVVRDFPHPLRKLVDAGVTVTLSTDDPSLFRTTLPQEYERARRHGLLTERELRKLACNGIDAAFIDGHLKAQLHHRLDQRWPREE